MGEPKFRTVVDGVTLRPPSITAMLCSGRPGLEKMTTSATPSSSGEVGASSMVKSKVPPPPPTLAATMAVTSARVVLKL